MNKRVILNLVLIFALFAGNKIWAQDAEELTWYSFDDGYKKAVAENKIVLIDVYTDWCGWCKVMDKNTYADGVVIDAINKNFVAVKLNPEQDKEYTYQGKKYSGRELVKLLSENKLRGYPSTLFHFPKTKTTHLEVGYLEPDAFKEALQKYVEMLPKN